MILQDQSVSCRINVKVVGLQLGVNKTTLIYIPRSGQTAVQWDSFCEISELTVRHRTKDLVWLVFSLTALRVCSAAPLLPRRDLNLCGDGTEQSPNTKQSRP